MWKFHRVSPLDKAENQPANCCRRSEQGKSGGAPQRSQSRLRRNRIRPCIEQHHSEHRSAEPRLEPAKTGSSEHDCRENRPLPFGVRTKAQPSVDPRCDQENRRRLRTGGYAESNMKSEESKHQRGG